MFFLRKYHQKDKSGTLNPFEGFPPYASLYEANISEDHTGATASLVFRLADPTRLHGVKSVRNLLRPKREQIFLHSGGVRPVQNIRNLQSSEPGLVILGAGETNTEEDQNQENDSSHSLPGEMFRGHLYDD